MTTNQTKKLLSTLCFTCLPWLLLIYVLVIPLIWSMVVCGRYGVSPTGQVMHINGVIPYPGRGLWCYTGDWLCDEEMQIGGQRFKTSFCVEGLCYVNEMQLEPQ